MLIVSRHRSRIEDPSIHARSSWKSFCILRPCSIPLLLILYKVATSSFAFFSDIAIPHHSTATMKTASLLLAGAVAASCSPTANNARNAPYKSSCTPPNVFVDFDGTVSVNETILILGKAVYDATPADKVTLPPLPYVNPLPAS